MGISIAQATLQSLVDQHNGVSYKEALEEIRAYIAEVQKPSHNKPSAPCPDYTSGSQCLWGFGGECSDKPCTMMAQRTLA